MQATCFDGGDFKRGFNLQINFWSAEAAPYWSDDVEVKELKIEFEGSWLCGKLGEK